MSRTSEILRGELVLDAALAHYNTWRVGGSANKLYKPEGTQDLIAFLRQLPDADPILWLGLGSNVLIRDGGFAGCVILTQGGLNELTQLDANRIRVESGISCAKMARFCARIGLGGGEFWAGIPGTMGGALRMNAGCFNGETWKFVESVETIDRSGNIAIRYPEEFTINYRDVRGLRENEWFLSAICKLPQGNSLESFETIKQLLARRTATQPTNEYNCGSVFRNPPGGFAAQIIESLGLKGMQIGHAVVSEKHANFIINKDGRARASEIEALIAKIQKTVHEKTGILLHQEVHIIGKVECQSKLN